MTRIPWRWSRPWSPRWRPSITTPRDISDPRHREIFAHRIIAKLPTIAAAAYKHTLGQPFIYPRNDLRYCANMVNMFFGVPGRALRHRSGGGGSASTSCSFCTPTTSRRQHLDGASGGEHGRESVRGDFGRASPRPGGPAHGGANEAVLDMLDYIGSIGAHRQVPGAGQGQDRQRAAHGLRSPRLQEFRSPRENHPRACAIAY